MSNNIQYYHHTSFELESREKLTDMKIAYHTFGEINEDKGNVIWVFHALTANSDVMDWWKGLFGESEFFNPKDYFIVCANVIGSPYGSTVPNDFTFPQFTLRDVVNAHLLLANELNINEINIAIGGSFGGNQAVEFAYSFKGNIENLILIASCSRESAWGIGIHESQRMALQADISFGKLNGGEKGLKAARAIGMLTYRTSELFVSKQTDLEDRSDGFRAASYIRYQGEKFRKRFTALSYYYLTKCLDSHNIGRDRGGEVETLKKIIARTLVIGIDTDILIPVSQQKYMTEHIPNSIYKEIHSDYGHDGFLIETEKITKKIVEFLDR